MLENHSVEEIELAKLPLARIHDVVLSRIIVREEAARLGFAPRALTQIATAVSEITRNVMQHSRSTGHLRVLQVTSAQRNGLKIEVNDNGVGIRDVDHVLAGAAAGAGIPGARQLVDEFSLQSSEGAGTSVTMMKWLPATP